MPQPSFLSCRHFCEVAHNDPPTFLPPVLAKIYHHNVGGWQNRGHWQIRLYSDYSIYSMVNQEIKEISSNDDQINNQPCAPMLNMSTVSNQPPKPPNKPHFMVNKGNYQSSFRDMFMTFQKKTPPMANIIQCNLWRT